MSEKISAVVLGGTGYVGGELLRLLSAHPQFEVAAAVSESRSGEPIAATFANLAHSFGDQRYVSHDDWLDTIDEGGQLALFSAAPHGASAALIADALSNAEEKNLTVHVVDSSADFRFASELDYEAVYGTEHGAPELLSQFQSGVPEHVSDLTALHIGHPGCFATAILLAAVPLIQSGLTDSEIFVTGITGSTGSGRSPQPGTHHPERHSNMYAYKPLSHVQAKATERVSEQMIRSIYEKAYAESAFVNVVSGTPRLKSVVASNYCQIGVASSGDTVVVMSVIDNLVKGAAGGAVQWMNRLWNLPETTGLTAAAPGWT